MSKRIPKPNRETAKGRISTNQSQTLRGVKVTFSFEFYDTVGDAYCISCWSKDHTKLALQRLGDINAKTFMELKAQGETLHFHEVDWAKTIEKSGLPANAACLNDNPWQIALLSVNGQKTRVFGSYMSDVFYIVWFDLHHAIWPVKLKHT